VTATNATADATSPAPLAEAAEAPPQFSDQAFALWARMHDGSWFLAIVDPEPPEEPEDA
jgi:hypothetical protein